MLDPASYDDIAWDEVDRLSMVLFLQNDGRVVLIRDGDSLSITSGPVQTGERPYIHTSVRLPLEHAGFRRQHGFAFAAEASHVAMWVEGYRYHGPREHRERSEWWVGSASEAAALLREQGDDEDAQLVESADAARRALTDAQYFAESARLFEQAYLDEREPSPRKGSGFGRSEEDWRAGRAHLCDAIDRDGTFLDVGCANGYLLECLVRWAHEDGHRIEPFGVDLAPKLVVEAQRRLPAWHERFFVGNALTWVHPDGLTFDTVHTLLDYVLEPQYEALVSHLLDDLVAPGGRLVVSHYVNVERRDLAAGRVVTRLGFIVAGETAPPAGSMVLPSAWIDKPRVP